MSRVFFTSDLHLGHKNLVEGLRHMSVEENDSLIINNWNNVIHKKDIVYILGDFVMEKPQLIPYYLSQLKGNIRLVGGNHDTRQCCEMFASLGIPVLGCLKYKGFICTHMPVFDIEKCRGNLHGHIHLPGNIEGVGEYAPTSPEGRYYNVNVEFNNYTPILFDDIVNLINKT